MTLAGYDLQDNVYIYSNNKCMCVFLISPVPIAEPLTSELIDTPVFYNLAPRPIKYRVSVPIPSNRWSLPHTKGKWRYLSPLCHHHIVFITVKVSSSSVLACQGFPACLLCCVHPSTAHWSPDRSLRHCDTEMHTCCFYWPMTLSVENQSRNKKQRVKEGRERGKRDAC